MDFSTEFLDENQAFGAAILGAAQETPVPTCPDWTFRQLFRHVGRGHRWAAQIITERTDIDPATVPNGRPPDDLDGVRRWLLEGGQLLVDAAADAGADAEVWTFLGPRPASWWVRRRLHETLVHRADVAIALGADLAASPAVAADAVSEWLDIALTRGPGIDARSMHLHATDDGLAEAGEWMIADGSWSHAHSKGDIALRGPAVDLLLATTRRRALGDTAIEVFGDESVWQTWLANAKF